MKNPANNNLYSPPLFGLVLAGGKSVRMGRDKGLLRWHDKAQRYYLADLLENLCERTFISCRADQAKKIADDGYQALPDNAPAEAQYGAILSAMSAYPDSAWLVVACDLPLLDLNALTLLVHQRDPLKLATAFKDGNNGLPEPLAAIWEPRARDMLIQKLSEGVTCPRKALIRSAPDVKLILPAEPATIMNVNTPEAAKEAMAVLKSYAAK